MKKLLFFAAATAVALSSCSKDEVTATAADSQNEISFSAYSAVATKAYAETNADVFKTSGFTVSAVYSNGSDVALMSGVALTTNDEGVSYKATDTYYWPTDLTTSSSVYFVGYYGLTLSSLSTSTGAAFSSFDASSGEEDPVIAMEATTSSSVALTFEHALAMISTAVEDKSDDTNLTLYIDDITYSGFDGAAICSVTTAGVISWNTSETDATFVAHNTADTESTSVSATSFTLIPNTVTATIKGYWMQGSAVIEDFRTNGKSVANLTVEQGKSYTYNFQITPNSTEITFTATVTGWDATGNSSDKAVSNS